MANWLEITNTFIGFETMQRVGDLSRTQQQVANQMLAVEFRKQKDNALLSQLVDIVVKVRQFLQDKQFFDALLSAGVGALAFRQLYPQIVDADAKLKSSDIQVKLLDTIRSTIADTSIRVSIQASLVGYLSTIKNLFQPLLTQSNPSSHKLVWLNPAEEWTIDVGEEFIPIQDVINLTNKVVIFRKGNLYKVIEVNSSSPKGFYLINDLGQKWYLFFGKKGGAGLFAFLEPPLPNLDQEIMGWELCDKLFSHEFLIENLKSVLFEMLDIYGQAFEQAGITRDQLANRISQYRQFREAIVQRALQSPEIQAASKPKESWIFLIIGISIGLLIFLIKNC